MWFWVLLIEQNCSLSLEGSIPWIYEIAHVHDLPSAQKEFKLLSDSLNSSKQIHWKTSSYVHELCSNRKKTIKRMQSTNGLQQLKGTQTFWSICTGYNTSWMNLSSICLSKNRNFDENVSFELHEAEIIWWRIEQEMKNFKPPRKSKGSFQTQGPFFCRNALLIFFVD